MTSKRFKDYEQAPPTPPRKPKRKPVVAYAVVSSITSRVILSRERFVDEHLSAGDRQVRLTERDPDAEAVVKAARKVREAVLGIRRAQSPADFLKAESALYAVLDPLEKFVERLERRQKG